jgi:hypothetical protein
MAQQLGFADEMDMAAHLGYEDLRDINGNIIISAVD